MDAKKGTNMFVCMYVCAFKVYIRNLHKTTWTLTNSYNP